ncbi:MBL fold metallo-hydrolase [Candidatus Bathyarchaeota archaeon]|nr:MBL fold metallo-hydrolase [Candidatus Bathyarchaeota archaeon]
MEIEYVKEDIGFIQDAVNIGVIKNGSEAILVDSGLDKDTARDIRKTVEEEGLSIAAIINTHSHADHFGGNDYFVRNLGAKIYAPEIESGIIQYPILEPVYLFNGANPINNLRNKFVLAKPSPVDYVIHPGKLEINGIKIDIIPLPGHSFNQMGVLFQDVLFCADSLFSERVINKYRIPVLHDTGSQLKTLNKLEHMTHSFYVPSHTKPTNDLSRLISVNRGVVEQIIDDIRVLLVDPLSTEEVNMALCNRYDLELPSVQQFYLIQMTLMAYLGYLKEKREIGVEVKGNRLRWNLIQS